MSRRIAVGVDPGKRMYVNAMWSPITQLVHVPVGNLQMMRVISDLFHEIYHVDQIPDVEAAKGRNATAIEIEAYTAQRSFNDRLLAFVEEHMKSSKSLLRWKREIGMINANIDDRIKAYREARVPSMKWSR